MKGATLADMTKRSYRLTVQGELSDNLEPAFPGMTLTRSDGNTALAGEVRDQAELQGLLQRVSDLGLTLLEAQAVDDLPGRRPDVHREFSLTRRCEQHVEGNHCRWRRRRRVVRLACAGSTSRPRS